MTAPLMMELEFEVRLASGQRSYVNAAAHTSRRELTRLIQKEFDLKFCSIDLAYATGDATVLERSVLCGDMDALKLAGGITAFITEAGCVWSHVQSEHSVILRFVSSTSFVFRHVS